MITLNLKILMYNTAIKCTYFNSSSSLFFSLTEIRPSENKIDILLPPKENPVIIAFNGFLEYKSPFFLWSQVPGVTLLRQAQNNEAILETRMFLAGTSVSLSDVNIIQNIPPQKLFHIHIIHIPLSSREKCQIMRSHENAHNG